MRKRYRQRSAPWAKCQRWCGQWGQGIGNLLRLAKKIVENPIVKNLEKMALKELPGVYEKDVKRSKMKKLKDCLGLTLQIL